MADNVRGIKKKQKKVRKKQASSTPLLFGAAGLGVVGMVLLIIASAISGRYQTLLLACGGLLVLMGIMLGLAVLVTSSGGIGFEPKKLCFLEDRIELRKGKRHVLGRLPFFNVATVEVGTVEVGVGFGGTSYRVRSADLVPGVYFREDKTGCPTVTVLLVRLYDPKDDDTFWPDKMRDGEWDIVILDKYGKTLGSIQREIQDGINRHIANKTDSGRARHPGI